MERMKDNKMLCRGLVIIFLVMALCTLGFVKPLDDLLELAPLPSFHFRLQLLGLLAADCLVVWLLEVVLLRVFSNTPAVTRRIPVEDIPPESSSGRHHHHGSVSAGHVHHRGSFSKKGLRERTHHKL